jgi:hypothetical protein
MAHTDLKVPGDARQAVVNRDSSIVQNRRNAQEVANALRSVD